MKRNNEIFTLKNDKEIDAFLENAKKVKAKEDVSIIKDMLDKSFYYNIVFQLKNGTDYLSIPTNYNILIKYLLIKLTGDENAEYNKYAEILKKPYNGEYDVFLSHFNHKKNLFDNMLSYDKIKEVLSYYDVKYIFFDDSVAETLDMRMIYNFNETHSDIVIKYSEL